MQNNVYWFIQNETVGFDVAVEFGAGKFDKITSVPCTTKIGVEIHHPYIEAYNPTWGDVKSVCGDMRDYRKLLEPRLLGGTAVCMVLDTIEHVDKDDGHKLIGEMQEDFAKILLITPDGFVKQDTDVWDMGGEEYQTHRCGWSTEELEQHGFRVRKEDNLLFGVW